MMMNFDPRFGKVVTFVLDLLSQPLVWMFILGGAFVLALV